MSDFPQPPAPIPPTTPEEIDKVLYRLQEGKQAWAELKATKREVLLRECLTDLEAVAEEWVRTAIRAKGVLPNTPEEGEEWIGAFMPVVRYLRQLIHAMKHNGAPPVPCIAKNAFGYQVATVFPTDLKEKLMFAGFSAELWLDKDSPPTQGKIYREDTPPRIAAVLGAGNQSSIGPMDCLYKLVVENQTCVLKMNPVNECIGPYVVRAFRSLIEGNFFTVVYGGAEVGQYLCQHELVVSIHITGSHHTHDAIVWGRPRAAEPILKKDITSELGCVDPIIITPGSWKKKELEYHARQVVSMVTHNAGYNCNAGNVLILDANWTQKKEFCTLIEKFMRERKVRKAYYPHTQERHQEYLKRYTDAILCSPSTEETVPWTILPQVPAQKEEYALNNEPFCGILAITELASQHTSDFLSKVSQFCNAHVWGTLSCTLIIDPKSAKTYSDALEQCINDLRYGTIAINAWNGVSYSLGTTTWGAYPGHTIDDIKSGIGLMHNSLLFDHPHKSVLRAPFTVSPTPAWFYSNRNHVKLGKRLVAFEFKPSIPRLLGVIVQALKG